MNLVASLIVRNEVDRYLPECIAHLREFCDRILVIDDGSDDATGSWLHEEWVNDADGPLVYESNPSPAFFVHEGRARQALIDLTLAWEPTHVISLDADEFVSDGAALRARLEADPDYPAWQLDIEEVWTANEHLYTREDGGWRTHGLACVWKAPAPGEKFTIMDRKLACRRVPEQVLKQRSKPTGVSLLHFGWTNPAERKQRYDRYVKHDGGKFHASAHLRSIMWPPPRIKLRQRPWPEGEVFACLRDRFAAVNA